MGKVILLLSIVLCVTAYTIALPRLEMEEPKYELIRENEALSCKEDSDCPQPKCFQRCSYFACENSICVLKPPKKEACVVGGCSGELCVSEIEDTVSNCLWKEHYRCYAEYGNCIEENGTCKWEETRELQKCIEDES
ncbi:unnamed protein product [Blepharisma stoltei]|uniref:Uncharacterized protein n=1 Tax=Blepharisma stoltei TaxID=1481888 RepID=A0AAU9K2X7_9CILI|nr:unnamed protein product [Blepharisma stoltei]